METWENDIASVKNVTNKWSEARMAASTAVGISIYYVYMQPQMRWTLTLKGLEKDDMKLLNKKASEEGFC